MYFVDSDIKEFEFNVTNQNALYRLVEYLYNATNESDKSLLIPVYKSEFLKEFLVASYLGGFDVYVRSKDLSEEIQYYVKDVTDKRVNKKFIFLSKNQNLDLIQKMKDKELLYFRFDEENEKWKKIKTKR